MYMRRALKDRLANYKVPQELKILEGSIPRNAMGKGISMPTSQTSEVLTNDASQ